MSDFIQQDQEQPGQENFSAGFPPKPAMLEKQQNALTRSLISLFVYALLFYFIFDRNLAYIASILVVIIIHEMGHFFFMKLFGYSNVKIFIIPLLGAFTTGKKQQVSQWQLSLIILGGPVPGILIGTALFLFNLDLQNDTLKMLSYSFLIINLLNCLPFYPLDGGKLVETLFFRENYTIRLVFGIISILVLFLIFIATSAFIMLIIPFIISMELYNEHKNQKIRNYLRQEKINYYVDYNSLPDKDYWLIRDCLIFSFPKKYVGLQPGRHEYSISEPLLMNHVNSVLQVNLKLDLRGLKRVLMLLFYIAVFVAPLVIIALNSKLL